jgi:hypothetical protein
MSKGSHKDEIGVLTIRLRRSGALNHTTVNRHVHHSKIGITLQQSHLMTRQIRLVPSASRRTKDQTFSTYCVDQRVFKTVLDSVLKMQLTVKLEMNLIKQEDYLHCMNCINSTLQATSSFMLLRLAALYA